MKEFKSTWLYLKQHNVIGLKYFGKTIRDSEQCDGSGIYRNREHKRKLSIAAKLHRALKGEV